MVVAHLLYSDVIVVATYLCCSYDECVTENCRKN